MCVLGGKRNRTKQGRKLAKSKGEELTGCAIKIWETIRDKVDISSAASKECRLPPFLFLFEEEGRGGRG